MHIRINGVIVLSDHAIMHHDAMMKNEHQIRTKHKFPIISPISNLKSVSMHQINE